MKTLEQLQSELEAVKEQIKPLAELKSSLNQEILNLKSEFKIGDVISWNGRVGRVVQIKDWVCGDPMWTVIRIKKDGSEGMPEDVRPYTKPVKVSVDVK
jgi:hypothetical protein